MPRSWIPALLALAGCAGTTTTRSRDYDALLGELRRTPSDGEAALAHVVEADRLDRRRLIDAVLARNPGLTAMRAAWRAAAAEVRAAGSLADPMVRYELAPLSIAHDAPFGHRLEVSQRLPFPGKRALAGDVAVAEAEVARDDWRAATLELAQLASNLYDDLVFVDQALEVNDHHRQLADRLKQAAEAQLAAGRGSPQDSLAAVVELGRLAQERAALEAERANAVARIDGLLHRPPDAPLPAPVGEFVAVREPPPLDALLRTAAGRPDTAAAGDRIAGARAGVAAAERAFYPDLELMGSYDSMWPMVAHRWMIGIGIELPIQRGKRHADLEAARARVTRARAELDRLHDDVRVEVFRARRDVVAQNAIASAYATQLVPAARAQLEAALQGFVIGRNDFTAVIAAERNARDIELGELRARAELAKRRAALERALGRLPGGGVS